MEKNNTKSALLSYKEKNVIEMVIRHEFGLFLSESKPKGDILFKIKVRKNLSNKALKLRSRKLLIVLNKFV